jgi:ribonucleotide monophosphatase NagD (HAD superfamily)
MIKISLTLLDSKPGETAIVGDRIETDVVAGKRAGLKTILVLTGVSSKRDVERVKGTKLAPDFVIQSLREMVVN